MPHPLEHVFHPRSIAVAGASPERRSLGNAFLRLLLEYGFRGPVYPVHPTATVVEGQQVYASVDAIPGDVDYVISSVPAPAVPDLVAACASKGVRVLHLFTARFSETGRPEAAALERRIGEMARAAGLRLIGPNCMGLYVPAEGIHFRAGYPTDSGPIAFVTQSGGNASELVYRGALRGLRFSKVISYGNALDLTESDFLEYLCDDPDTTAVGLYVEGVRDGARLLTAASALRRHGKPVVALKGGRTAAGTRSVASHTGSLAGDRASWEAFCRQAGVLPASDLEEMVDLLVAFRYLPPAAGTSVAVMGGGGGRTVQSADDCEAAGLTVTPFPSDIRSELRERAPLVGDWLGNPVDASIAGGTFSVVPEMMRLMGQHPQYDLVIINMAEDFMLDRPEAGRRLVESVRGYLEEGSRIAKPLAVVLGYGDATEEWRWRAVIEARDAVWQAGFAVYPTIGRAARALRRFVDWHRDRDAAPAP